MILGHDAALPPDREPRTLRTIRHADAEGVLEMVSGDPDPRLRAVALDYTGYRERSAGPMRRRELPWPGIVLIFDFGPTLRFLDADGTVETGRHHGGFLAGLHNGTVLTETVGAQSGLHVNLTPLGARRLLGLPMHELANRVVGVGEVFGPAGGRLVERLLNAPGWAERFDLLDAAIARRLAATEPLPGIATAGWRRLEASGGRIAIADLAASLDCSRKHLGTVFREHLGLSPKTVARVLRFHRAIGLYDRGLCSGWADVAYECGYTDQAHFVNDFRRFAGVSPTVFLATRRPMERATLPG
ncbi:helix-turn-helix domain-containing protein [Thalassobaculum sp.]|uniref:helix-turn-helix domain-containing protein n=1 Tax=Thalassobaculum sp. TaxID=2022740 RepID=UPI0032EF6170